MSALALWLAPSAHGALFVAAPAPPSSIASAPKNACTAFFEASEPRIGLLCHNDPVNKSDPTGEIAPAIIAAWAVAEAALTAYDIKVAADTLSDPNASFADKMIAVGGAAAGAQLPGGGYGKLGILGKHALTSTGSQTARPFRELLGDIKKNPDNWIRTSAHTEARQGGKGTSIQEVYQNKKTGETMVKHTIVTDKGRVVDQHYRPMYKRRMGE